MAIKMLYGSAKRNRYPSRPDRPADDVPTTILCGEITLPATPPVAFVTTVSTGCMSIDSAVIFCMLQKRALEEVSLPVTNTPSQPRKAETNGKTMPAIVNALPRVTVMPDQLATYAKPSTLAVVSRA